MSPFFWTFFMLKFMIISMENECGISYNKPNVKIIGGVDAVPASWPSIAKVKFSFRLKVVESNSEHVYTSSSECGGTLIAKNVVLTAAHCLPDEVKINKINYIVEPNEFHKTLESMFTVYLGLYNLQDIKNKNSQNYVQAKVKRIIKHENFNKYYLLNDIALLVLSEEVELNHKIQIACLPSYSTTHPDKQSNVYAAGWGRTNINDKLSIPNSLKNVKLIVYPSSYCEGTETYHNWASQICAGDLKNHKDTCQGDSGGPLYFIREIDGQLKHEVSGITSYGIGCADPEYGGIYTRVSYFIKWINTNIESVKQIKTDSNPVEKECFYPELFICRNYFLQMCDETETDNKTLLRYCKYCKSCSK